jgi:hypothetical protein
MTRLILVSRNTILLERPSPPPALLAMILVYKPTVCPIKVRMRWRFGFPSATMSQLGKCRIRNTIGAARKNAVLSPCKLTMEHERATLLRMAEQWERLAEHKEKKEAAN